MIPEPANELYAAVKAIANPWPPDSEEAAQQLGTAWTNAGNSVTQAGTQIGAVASALTSAWPDPAGAALGTQIAGCAKALQQVGQSATQLAGMATQYGQVLVEVKTAITKTIAANLPTYLQLGNPQFGAAGAAQQQAMAAQIAETLRAMIEAEAAKLRAASSAQQLTPGQDKARETLKAVGDWAGAISAVAGFAALFPPLAPFAVTVAALSGGLALVAHGIVAAHYDSDDPNAWVSVGSDALGLVPGVRAFSGVAKVIPEAATSVDAVKSLLDVGLQGPVVYSQFDSSPDADADANSAGLASLGSNVFGVGRMLR